MEAILQAKLHASEQAPESGMTGFCQLAQACKKLSAIGRVRPVHLLLNMLPAISDMPMQPRQENIVKCSPDEESSDPWVPDFCQVGRRCVQGKAYAEPVHHLPSNKHWECHCSRRQDSAHPCIYWRAPQRSQHAVNTCRPGCGHSLTIHMLPGMHCRSYARQEEVQLFCSCSTLQAGAEDFREREWETLHRSRIWDCTIASCS